MMTRPTKMVSSRQDTVRQVILRACVRMLDITTVKQAFETMRMFTPTMGKLTIMAVLETVFNSCMTRQLLRQYHSHTLIVKM